MSSSSSATSSEWDQLIASWKAGGQFDTVYIATLDILHDGDTSFAKSFRSDAWLYFNRPAPAPKWTPLSSAQVIRPLRWQPIANTTAAANGTLLFAGVLHHDAEAKDEFERIDDELRALITVNKYPATFRFRLQLCKLMAQVEGAPIITAGAEPKKLLLVPSSWSSKHPIAAAIASIPARVADAVHRVEEKGEEVVAKVSAKIHGTEVKAKSDIQNELKRIAADIEDKAGHSFTRALDFTDEEFTALADFVAVAESAQEKKIPFAEALQKAAHKSKDLTAAVRKILAADVGGELLIPEQEDDEECDPDGEAKIESGVKPLVLGATSGANATGGGGSGDGTAQTRRIAGPSNPPTPQLAMVNPSELTSRLSTTVYQWATQFLICPRIQPTTNWRGEPNGVPKPENVSALSLFGFMGLIKVLVNPINPNRVPSFFPTLESVPVRDGLGKQYPTDWSSDAWFVRQRLEGCNSSMITIVKTLPTSWVPGLQQTAKVLGWTDAQVAAEQKKLQGLIDAKELYAVDYSASFLAPDTVHTPLLRVNSINNQYLAAPIALFRLDRAGKTFVPIGIQVESDTVRFPGANMIYMQDPANGWQWRYAKMALQSADWNYHEIGSHLTKTHLCIEVVAVSAHRNLSEQHPLYQLLVPHFINTMSLNFFARSTLVPNVISGLSPLGLAGSLDFAQYLYNVWDIRVVGAPDDLIARGFNPDTINTDLPTYYEARDSLGLWKILQTFVSSVVAMSYPADVDGKNPSITADIELQAWVKELQKQLGRGFPDINDSVSLIKVLTTIIYTASVKHSAVNYLQDYYWSYMPNAPPFFRQVAPVVSQIPTQAADRDTYYSNYIINSIPDKAAESGQDAVVSTLSQPAPSDYTLKGFAQSRKARRNNLTAWMNTARDVLQANLSTYDAAIQAENRPAPGYNILKSSKTATSIRI